ncbi:chromate transporter [Acidiphilium acidophilum]|uniref:chromate transporter n=1 Tax=Acidiphilium acidophilum TaxID=76588 RepID=UPI002E8E6AF0|nr:chromate transporter [Acidiphilium acidophilum]
MVDVAPQASPDRLSRSALFNGFFIAGLSGFGGVLPFARRIIVERKRWLTDAEFADLFSLCQFLPGPNIVNLAAAFGARHRGASGALAAMGGLLAAPITIVILLGLLFERYGRLPDVHHGLEGLAAAAAGLILATALENRCSLAAGSHNPRGRHSGVHPVCGAASPAAHRHRTFAAGFSRPRRPAHPLIR